METQATIGQWCDDTFPGADPSSPRKAIRVLEEVIELCLAAGASPMDIGDAAVVALNKERSPGDWCESRPNPAKIPAEAADALICLYGLAHTHGFDLHDAVDRKQAINLARTWKANGDGTGYHVKDESATEPTPWPSSTASVLGLTAEACTVYAGPVDQITSANAHEFVDFGPPSGEPTRCDWP